jgi:mono/diheme cytochrome c family protein
MRRAILAAALAVWAAEGRAQDIEAGGHLYLRYCAACHGMEGRGDGEMAVILTIRPTDLRGLSDGNDGVFPAIRTARQIDGRDPLLAHGGVMPLFGDFFEGQDVAVRAETGQTMMTSWAIADLLAFLETIQE